MNSGVLNLFKPKGMTSFDAVAVSRKLFNTKKVGHGGTLDPDVSGVLPILIGKATKIGDYLHLCNKTYIGELCLGIATDSDDSTGMPIQWEIIPELNEEKILELFESFKGKQMQTPPMVSAKKIKGKRLYKYAAEGREIERLPSEIKIFSLELLKFTSNKILFKTACSKGTYIRALCRDMAKKLGTVGYMSYLIRLSSGGLKIEDSISFERLKRMSAEERYNSLISIEEAIDFFPKVDVGEENYTLLSNGGKLKYTGPKEPFLLYAGKFLGIGISKKGIIRIDKLLIDGE